VGNRVARLAEHAHPRMRRVQVPPRFTVEVKGVSYERILSRAESWVLKRRFRET
jgi:hypothetical protein